MEVKELLCLLEERLVQHDNNRKEIQCQLQETCTRFMEEADRVEEKINKEIEKSFNEKEERILSLIEKHNIQDEKEGNDDLKSLTQQAREELSHWQQYEIKINEETKNFINQYNLGIAEVKNVDFEDENDIRNIVAKLQENLSKTRHSVTSVQDLLSQICTKRKNRGNEIRERINEMLERSFTQEDARIQELLNMIKTSDEVTEELIKKVKLTLLINQKYSLFIDENDYKLNIKRELSLKSIDFEKRKPLNTIASFTEDKGELSLSFWLFSDNEIEILKTANDPTFNVSMKVWEKDRNEEENAKLTTKRFIIGKQQISFIESFKANTTYCLKMRIEHQELYTQWSEETTEFTTPCFKDLCVWKECHNDGNWKRKYSVDENNPRIATIIGGGFTTSCNIMGNTFLPLNKVTSWNIRVLESKLDDGFGIYIGVAPFDIDQDEEDNLTNCGWYFDCFNSTLFSGLPYEYRYKEYGPRKWRDGGYVYTGDSVGVIMDTEKGELSFVLNGTNLGIAYEGIPLDKPVVPCVFLGEEGDSVELVI